MHTLAAHLGDFMVQCCSKAKGQCVKTALNAPDCQPKEGSTATDEEICFMMFLPPRCVYEYFVHVCSQFKLPQG